MSFVLDASVALAFCFQDEATDFTDFVLDQLRKNRAVVPALWVYEVTNGFVIGERRQRIGSAEARKMLAFLASLPIDVQPMAGDSGSAVGSSATQGLHSLAHALNITAYDAAYLELCQRLDVPLATLDGDGRRKGLKQAAAQAKVPLLAMN